MTQEEFMNLVINKLSDMDKKIDVGFAQIDTRFAEMDKKIDVGLADLQGEIKEVRGEIKNLNTKFTLEIKNLDLKFTAGLDNLEQKFTGEIKNLETKIELSNQTFMGEVKNLETKIDGFNARLGFQEFVSRSLLVGGLVAVSASAVKFAFFPNIPLA